MPARTLSEARASGRRAGRLALALSLALCLPVSPQARTAADAGAAEQAFAAARGDALALRHFLFRMPKGADLHNHLDGAVYAESYIAWAAADGLCVALESQVIVAPPCSREAGRPALRDVQHDAAVVNELIDAFSTRNYERRPVSGHDQFFSTFARFHRASVGREGYMIAEAAARAARQNILYLELMQSFGMAQARALARQGEGFDAAAPVASLVDDEAVAALAAETIAATDRAEAQWRGVLACAGADSAPGCEVTVRYLAQVIRVFPPEQVLAQTLLAFELIERDPRYVGLNFVAPEDHPITLRDHRLQMEMIGALARHYPSAREGIALHAGELTMGLVPPEHLGRHIREAVEIAGASRIGHGVDIRYAPAPFQLMQTMARAGIAVEINLTSNDVILGVTGEEHPFSSYRRHGVPLTLSTDDEGVSRIDLTHEYQRAVETYGLSYTELKTLSRNALAYSFLPGEPLFADTAAGMLAPACRGSRPGVAEPLPACRALLEASRKARLQWALERRFARFEAGFEGP